jgi:hypothetical protein
MKTQYITAAVSTFIVVMVLLIGCEEIVPVDDATSVERLVIRGVLDSGKPISNLYIGRTLPLQGTHGGGEGFVTDAHATIVHRGETFVLQHRDSGKYANADLVVASGEEYQLRVEWNGLRASASTRVPFAVSISESVSFRRTVITYPYGTSYSYAMEHSFVPRVSEVYGLRWTYIDTSTGFFRFAEGRSISISLLRNQDRGSNERLLLTAEGYINTLDGRREPQLLLDTLTAYVYTFDEPFYDYFVSSPNHTGKNELDLALGTRFPGIRWNVSGTAIGMFIGRAVTKQRILRGYIP